MSKYVITIVDNSQGTTNLDLQIKDGRKVEDIMEVLRENRQEDLTNAEIVLVNILQGITTGSDVEERPQYDH